MLRHHFGTETQDVERARQVDRDHLPTHPWGRSIPPEGLGRITNACAVNVDVDSAKCLYGCRDTRFGRVLIDNVALANTQLSAPSSATIA